MVMDLYQNYDAIVSLPFYFVLQLGVEFGSKLITLPDDDKVVKLQCTSDFLSLQFI